MWNQVNSGSNLIRNTAGIIRVGGISEPQIHVERGSGDLQLLLAMNVYDASAKHVARLRRNAWVFNDAGGYEVTTDPQSWRLSNKRTGETVVEVRVGDRDSIEIPYGSFYSPSRVPIRIAPDGLEIGGVRMVANIIDACGDAIFLRQGEIGIGG